MKSRFQFHRLAFVSTAQLAAIGLAACLLSAPQTAWSQAATGAKPAVTPAAAAKPAATPAAAAKPAVTTAATTAATPAAAGSTKGSGSGPILTRDELRQCFSQEESVRKSVQANEADRARLNQEKTDIATAQQALAADRAPLEELKKQADEFGGRLKAFAAKVEAWNKRVAAINDEKTEKPNATQSERLRAELAKEREDLGKESALLETEKARINATSQEAVGKYNTKAGALDARVKDWNERNARVNETLASLEGERKTWVSGCSDRRYREEDEIAIRAGK